MIRRISLGFSQLTAKFFIAGADFFGANGRFFRFVGCRIKSTAAERRLHSEIFLKRKAKFKLIMKNTKKILIGCDGSEYTDAVIEDLKKAGLPESAEAVVMTVCEAWELPMIVDRVSPGAGGFVHPNVWMIKRHLAN